MTISSLAKFNPSVDLDETERNLLRNEIHVSRGTMTITANQGTTTVSDAGVRAGDIVQLSPTSASASTESWWISATATGSFTVTHANSAATDRTFTYSVLRG